VPLDVKGIKELDNALAQLPDRVAKTALKKAVRAAANEIRAEARTRAPHKHVRRAVIVRRENTRGTDQYTVTDDIGINVKVAPDWHWYEFGIPRSWEITAKQKKSLYSAELKKFFGPEVTHPPLPATPFLRPAAAAAGPAALDTLKRALAQAIMIEASKLARKG
jgi:HK97 gp10 family phage protein